MTRLLAVIAVLGCSSSDAPEQPPPAKPPNPFETFTETAPRAGDVAPPFTLRDTEGASLALADAVARGPVVVVSGSFSCPLFRMKVPRFEDLARRWEGKATVLFVYVQEAHARAASGERLQGFAGKVRGLDKDRDGNVSVAEYGSFGPRYMFDAFDVDHDGIVRSHEIIAAQRIDQFRELDAPKTLGERITLARRFRAEVPGTIRVLIDPFENPTAKAYGELPNFAYVIGKDGKVAFKQGWAAVKDVERELQRLAGERPSAPRQPDLALLADARRAGKPILVELVAPGCDACKRMATTISDAGVQRALEAFTVVKLGVEQDPAWRLLEDLDLAATPAFAIIAPDGTIKARLQGEHARDAFLSFLGV